MFHRLCGFIIVLAQFVTAATFTGCDRPKSKPPTKTEKVIQPSSNEIAAQESVSSDLEQTATSGPVTKSLVSELGPIAVVDWTAESWSQIKLALLATDGPILLSFSVNADGQSLDLLGSKQTEAIAKPLLEDSSELAWDDLLDKPLIKSGWLGNLVPDESQRGHLIAMYDTDRDDKVSLPEMPAFLSRGLSRVAAIVVTEGNAESRASPWGKLDTNGDYTLDAQEYAAVPMSILGLDRNGDRVVDAQESQADVVQTQMGSSMLAESNMLQIPSDEKAHSQFAQRVMTYYTFLAELPRDQWGGWTNEKWTEVDLDSNAKLSKKEIQKLVSLESDVTFRIQLASTTDDPSSKNSSGRLTIDLPSVNEKVDEKIKSTARWQSSSALFLVSVSDTYGDSLKSAVRQQLQAALQNVQLQAAFRTQLQLSEGAFEVLDADQDEKLSDDEFENAWRWMTAIRNSRVELKWNVVASPWFHLLDQDGNGRVTEVEVAEFLAKKERLDPNRDGMVTPNEIPLVVKVEVLRRDSRLPTGAMRPSNETPAAPLTWFTAMDVNQDGTLNKAEFLGSNEDFSRLDSNFDGFISLAEVYGLP